MSLTTTDEFDQKFKSYNVEYKKKDALIAEQKKLIDERNKNIKALLERIKTLEKKIETETDAKDQLIKKLTHQCEAQSGQLASLTYQLHVVNKSKKVAATADHATSKELATNSNAVALTVAMATSSDAITSHSNSLSGAAASTFFLNSPPTQSNSNKKPSSPKVSKQTRSTKNSVDMANTLVLDETSLTNFELNIPQSAKTSKSDHMAGVGN